MAISDEDIQKVPEASDLIAVISDRVDVRQRGRDFWCCCPLHNEKTPSFKIDPSTQLWHCFGCGEGGDVFSFIMKADDVGFLDAVRSLADRAHIDIHETGRSGPSQSRKARLREICAATEEFYHSLLMRGRSDKAAEARGYLSGRGMGGDVAREWNLGFAPGRGQLVRRLSELDFKPDEMLEANVAVQREGRQLSDRFYDRVMFPIHDAQGACIAFGGRVIGQGEPKYLNSQETPLFHKSNVLYGLDKAKSAMASTGVAIVVEGYTDVISLHEAGIRNVVATLGTALTLQHVRSLSRHASRRIVYLFDGDEAGRRAADRALSFINEDMTPEAGKTQVELAAVTLPDDLDPADFVAARGADALNSLIDDAVPLILYGLKRRLSAHDLSTAEGRTRALTAALEVLAPIKDSLLAKEYALQLSSRLRMRESDVLAALASVSPPQPYARERQDAPGEPAAAPMPEGERSRRRFERRFVSILAQNPSIALENADALAQTSWHDPANAQLAESLLDVLAEKPDATPAQVVSAISAKVPRSAGALTSCALDPEDVREEISYLAEELEIGDLEASIAAMSDQLKTDARLSSEERDLMFRATVDMQNSLNAKRSAHKPLV